MIDLSDIPQIRLGLVDNPFRAKVERVDAVAWKPGLSIADVMNSPKTVEMQKTGSGWEVQPPSRDLVLAAALTGQVTVSLNGGVVPREKWAATMVSPGDSLVVMPTISGGNGQGKGIFRMIMIVAVAALTWWMGPGSWGALMTLKGAIFIGATVGALVLAGLSAFNPSTAGDDNLSSNSYTWNPMNTECQGVVIPKWYGSHRVFGNIISSYIERKDNEEFLNALVSFGYGPISGASNFRIDGQLARNYLVRPRIMIRKGWLSQTAIKYFAQTKTEYSMDIELRKNQEYIYTTEGTDYDGLEIDITFPQGLVTYDKKTGKYGIATVAFIIQYRRQGDPDWLGFGGGDTGGNLLAKHKVEQNRWSLGNYKDITLVGGVVNKNAWWEYQAGSSTKSDHEEYDESDISGLDAWWHWVKKDSYVYTDDESTGNGYQAVSEDQADEVRRTFKQSIQTLGIHEIKIKRVTDDHTGSTTISDDSYLTTVREVYFDKFQYPRHALMGVQIKATDQLSGSVEISAMLDGAIVAVYTSGVDENPSWVFSNNPAWVAWDILTQPVLAGHGTLASPYTLVRYDGIDPSRLDKAAFCEWADYCDEMVYDGFTDEDGNKEYEKRITFNGGFDYDTTMWEALMKVCQIARAVPVWNGINLTIAIDRAQDPSFLFAMGNIEETSFKETFLALEERATEVEIDFTNKLNNYERDKLTVCRSDIYSQYKATLDLFGITSPSEAWRAGTYRLNCNKYLLRTVNIDVDLEALACTIGDVGYIAHDVPKWGDSGRIVASTLFTVTLDRLVELVQGKTYKILLRLANDTLMERIVASATTTQINPEGTVSVLTVSRSLSADEGLSEEEYLLALAWYSNDWGCRQKVTIDHTKFPETVTDFPFAIVINDVENPIFSRAKSNGFDILFTAADKVTVLDYERSIWDPVNHRAVFYVKLPSVSPVTDTGIYIYYGNAGCAVDQQNKTGVWDAHFRGVFHFDTPPDSLGYFAKDSTQYENHGYVGVSWAVEHIENGPVGKSWTFNGYRNFHLDNNPLFDSQPTALTVESIKRTTGTSANQNSFMFMKNGIGVSDYYGGGVALGWLFQDSLHVGESWLNRSKSGVNLTEYHYWALSALQSAQCSMRYNAELIDTVAIGTFQTHPTISKHDTVGINSDYWGDGSRFYGAYSELRVSDIERSAAWMIATYENLINNAASFSLEEEVSVSEGSQDATTIDVKKYDNYVFGESTTVKKLYRVIAIEKSQDQKFALTLLNYDERIYDGDAETPPFGLSAQDTLDEIMQPWDVELEETSTAAGVGGATKPAIHITWTNCSEPDFRRIRVVYKLSTSSLNWRIAGSTIGQNFTIKNLSRGKTYDVRLLPIDSDGNILQRDRATNYQITLGEACRAADLTREDGTALTDSVLLSTVENIVYAKRDGSIVTSNRDNTIVVAIS